MYIQDTVMRNAINDMVNTLEPGEGYKFYKVATEALITNKDISAKSAMLMKLQKDITSRSLIDFESIPDSKGDFTKYKHYKVCMDTLDTLNSIYKSEARKFEEVELMNRLYDLLIALKADFMWGFQHNNEFLKLQYNTLVLTFYELETLCIMSYLKYVRDVKMTHISFDDYRKKDLYVIRSAKDFVACYDRGEWRKIVKALKEGNGAMETFMIATEATPGTGDTSSNPRSDGIFAQARSVGNWVKSMGDNVSGTRMGGFMKTAGKGILIIGGIIAAFLALRAAVFYFYNKAARVSDTLKLQTQFLEAATADNRALNPKTARNCDKMVSLANRIVGIIDGKIFGGNNKTAVDIKTSDRGVAEVVKATTEEPDVMTDDDFVLM